MHFFPQQKEPLTKKIHLLVITPHIFVSSKAFLSLRRPSRSRFLSMHYKVSWKIKMYSGLCWCNRLIRKDTWDAYFIPCSNWNFMIKKHFHLVFKSSRSEIIFKIGVLKHFAMFSKKDPVLEWCFVKLQPWKSTIL